MIRGKENKIGKIELRIHKTDDEPISRTIYPKESVNDANPLKWLQDIISICLDESNFNALETSAAFPNRVVLLKPTIKRDKYIQKNQSPLFKNKLFMMYLRKAINKKFDFFSNTNGSTKNLHYLAIKKDSDCQLIHIAYKTDINENITVKDLHEYFTLFCNVVESSPFKQIDTIKYFNVIMNTGIDMPEYELESRPLNSYEDEFLYIEGSNICEIEKIINFDRIKDSINNDDQMYIEFLKKIRFITNYSSEIDIDEWIATNESFYFLDAHLMINWVNEMIINSFDYFSKKNTEFLTSEDEMEGLLNDMKQSINTFTISGLCRNHLKNLDDFGVSFKKQYIENLRDNINKRLNENTKKPILLRTECTQFSVIKFFENFEKYLNPQNFIFIQSKKFLNQEIQNFIESSFFSDSGPNLLVIECESISQDDYDDIYTLTKTWKNQSTKHILLIINTKYNQEHVDIEDDEISFRHLTHDTQDAILYKGISFKGSITTLNDLIKHDEALALIDAECLWQILSNNRLEV